jgi:hypothetical protein
VFHTDLPTCVEYRAQVVGGRSDSAPDLVLSQLLALLKTLTERESRSFCAA